MLDKLKNQLKKSIERKKMRHKYKQSFCDKFKIEPYYSSNYSNSSDIDIITVSFNSVKLIEYQVKLSKKFLKGNYMLIICDNSTKKEEAQKIRQICKENDITYIRVEDRTVPNGYSNSHAIALNWIWQNIIKKRKNNFAFLDHDLFPIKDLTPYDYIKNYPIYGRYTKRPCGIWYMWAGFAFFNWNHVKDLPLNFHRYKKFGFIPMKGKNWVDTGSANWKCLYSKLQENKLLPFEESFRDFVTNKQCSMDSENFAHYLDNKKWLHIFDGGNRQNTQTDRIDRIYTHLDEILKS